MRDIFTCIVNNVETDYNVTCLPETVETVAGIYGPTLQSTFETPYSLKQCDFRPVVETTVQSTLSSTPTVSYQETTSPTQSTLQTQTTTISRTSPMTTSLTTPLTTTSLKTPLTTSLHRSKCTESNVIITKGWNCVVPQVMNITTAVDFDKFCSIVKDVFDCILDGIEKQFNVSCEQKDTTIAIELFSPMFKNAFSLKNNPADCFIVTTTVISTPEMTSSNPPSSTPLSTLSETVATITTSLTPNPLLAKCKDSGVVLDKSLQCVLPYFEQISTAKDNETFCRLVDQIFQCIIDKIESEFGVTCSGKDKELAILSYGPTLQSSLSLSFAPTKCEFETTTITTPYIPSSAVPESKTTSTSTSTTRTAEQTTTTLPPSSQMTVPITTPVSSTTTLSPLQLKCHNEAEIMARGWQCALPLYSNLTTSSDLPEFCLAVGGVIECILSDIGYKYGVNCSRSDQQNALSFYGPTLQSSLPLGFNLTKCSLGGDGISVVPVTIGPETPSRVTSFPVTISSPVLLSTESLSLSVCKDTTLILSKGWVCALPKYMDISTANDMTAFCRATESVFTCILDSIGSEHGVTCTASYKDTVIETYSPNLRSISTASLDPRQCYITTTTPTTTTESPLLAKCQDSATITSAAYFCFLPLYINMTIATDKLEFCSVIEVAFSCIVKKIEADYSIRCREGDKEKMISNYGADLTTSLKLRFDPLNDCYNMSEKRSRIARSPGIARYSPCQASVELLAKGLYCLDLFHQNVSQLLKESSFENFCSGIAIFSSCVMTEMGKNQKFSCDEVEQEIFISNHSLSLEKTFGLAFRPADCFMASTTTVETTTTLPSLCLDSELIYVKLMLCAGPVFSSLKLEKNFKSFCGLSFKVFGCIIDKIESSENITCSKSDNASIAQLHGSEIYRRLALPFNPTDCFQSASTTIEPITQPSSSTVTETSTQPTTGTTTKTSTLSSVDSSFLLSTEYTTISIPTETTSNPTTIEPGPCRDINKVNMFILPCIGPVFSFILSTKNSTIFCGLMMRVFDCIVNKTERSGNVTCSSDDKKEIMEAIGLQMNKTLPLPFSPDLCTFLLEKPLVESTQASVTDITTPVDSISPLMTTASTTLVTTEPSPCQDVNRMNMFILPCIGPLFFTISSAKNTTAFCGYIVEVLDCIINKIEVEANKTCSQKDARELVQTIGLQMNKTLPFNINPMLCSERYGNFETTTTPSEFTTISIKDLKCKSKSEIFSQGIHCIGPYYKFLMTATQYGAVCSFLQLTFNCIFERIEKQHNLTCPSLVRNEARAMYAVDVYKGIPLKFQPDSCPGNLSCFIEVGRPEYRECFETFFIFDKYNGTVYNLKLSENEICSAYWGTIMCLQNREISCDIEDTHKILSQYLLDSNASITIPTACLKNTTLGRTVCADDDFPLLMIQAKCGFYPILIPFDCDRHGWEYIKCAADSLDPLKCNADSIYSAVTVLMQSNRSFFDRINTGKGEEVYSCINKTTFNWIATYKPNEDENNQPPRPLPEVIKMSFSVTISDIVWTSELLDLSSGHYRSVASYVMNNLTIAFGSEPEILQIEIVSFRRTIMENVTTVDLEVTFNTTSLSSINLDLQPENDTDSDFFYNLNVVSVSEFSIHTRNSSCPAVTSESIFCNDTCKDDFYCQSFEKCCSTGCGRTCQNSTDFRTNYTDYLSYPISRVLPKNAAQLLFSVTLPDFNWTNALLDPWSPYYKEIHAEIIRNFKQQMQNSQEFLYYDVLSFREGQFVIADIILTYDKYLISSSSVVNNLYMLHRHGFIQNLNIQGDVSYDKLVKPGSCPYPSLAILRSCSDTCTGDTACSGNLKCCFNGCARTCVTPGCVYALQLTTTEETFPSSPASGNTLQPSSSPSKVLRMSFVLKLVDYTWSSDLLQSSSDYYQKLKTTVIQNFNVQFSRMPGYVGVEIVSFRVGGPFVDLVITYTPTATDYATVLNTVFLLTKHGYIHYLQVHNYLRFDHVVKTGTCPPVVGLGPCGMNCTGDSKCPGKQKCCSNGCGLTCSDMIKTSPQTTNPPTTKPTTRPATIPTTPSTTLTTNPTTVPTTIPVSTQPETVSLLSVTIELQENTWNTSLLDPRSFYYQSLYSTIKTNILQLFRLKPGITDVFVQSFRSRNRVDLILYYNTESIALIDIITTLIAARSSGAIHDLKIHHYMTFDTQMKPGDCPEVLVSSGACLESCMGDGTCPGVEKCCSTGCGRVCTSVHQPV